jgi:LmbE family N-acetylglucosaminyl deacetylase
VARTTIGSAFLFGLLTTTSIFAAVRPLNLTSFENKRVLFITAHPDDSEGFAGGLVAALGVQSNVEVSYLIVTSGNAGGKCYEGAGNTTGTKFYDCEKEELAFLRRRESLNAASFLNVKNVWRLGVDDGMSIAIHETRVRRAISAYVRSYKPHVVVSHSPNADWGAPPTCNGLCPAPKNWDDLGYHPDHQHVGSIVFDTMYGSGSASDNDKLFEDLSVAGNLEKWKVEQLFFFALTKTTMTHYLELDENLLNKKVDASSKHFSQYQNVRPIETFQWVAEQAGEVAGVGMAEGYQGWF